MVKRYVAVRATPSCDKLIGGGNRVTTLPHTLLRHDADVMAVSSSRAFTPIAALPKENTDLEEERARLKRMASAMLDSDHAPVHVLNGLYEKSHKLVITSLRRNGELYRGVSFLQLACIDGVTDMPAEGYICNPSLEGFIDRMHETGRIEPRYDSDMLRSISLSASRVVALNFASRLRCGLLFSVSAEHLPYKIRAEEEQDPERYPLSIIHELEVKALCIPNQAIRETTLVVRGMPYARYVHVPDFVELSKDVGRMRGHMPARKHATQ